MLAEPAVLALSLAYLGLLFAVAYFGDRHARAWSASSVAPAALFATVGVLPYIALQLQAVSSSFRSVAAPVGWGTGAQGAVHTDTTLIVAAMMAAFTILFGVRNVQASEQHRGMMLAIAFESVVKLVALLAVRPFVLFFLFHRPPAP